MRTAARPFQSVETNANTQTLNHSLPRGLPSPVRLVVVPAALLTAAVGVTTAAVSLRTLRRRGTAEATLQRLRAQAAARTDSAELSAAAFSEARAWRCTMARSLDW